MLGADDGIVSVSGLLMGIIGSGASHSAVVTGGVAGVIAGALSMAAGEYVSISSQLDSERSDLARERHELAEYPEAELRELTEIYVRRGLDRDLAHQVAEQLHRHDAFGAHVRDELNLDPEDLSNPIAAASTSAAAFGLAASIPVVAAVLIPGATAAAVVVTAMLTLAVLGVIGARVGGAGATRAAVRVMVGGGMAMAVTWLIGRAIGSVGT